jgi:hypothetical protein
MASGEWWADLALALRDRPQRLGDELEWVLVLRANEVVRVTLQDRDGTVRFEGEVG